MAGTSDIDASASRPRSIYSASRDADPVCCIRPRILSSSFSFHEDATSSQSSVPSSVSSSSSRSFVSSSFSSSSLQSSKSSPLSSSSNASWENDDGQETLQIRNQHYTQGRTLVSLPDSVISNLAANHATCQPPLEGRPAKPVPIEQRQHPRRTQRLINLDSDNNDPSAPRPLAPPALVRQSERKEVFVDNLIGKPFAGYGQMHTHALLIDTTTQLIETIWPLSNLSCTRDSPLGGGDHNLIGLRTFVQEVLRRSKTSYSTLQVALYYLILIQSFVPSHDFTMEQLVDSQACRAMQCGRRMFLTALILASKYLQDRNYSARAWSKISGLRTSEINTNEMAFLAAIEWKLHVPEPLFNRWTDIVLKFSVSSSVSPTSPSGSTNSWRSIIPHLTPALDGVEFGGVSSSKRLRPLHLREDLGPSSLPTPPAESGSLAYFESNDSTPTNPYTIPKTLEPISCGNVSNRPILPPLRLSGLLPTPAMTPQTGTFCTPAASVNGLCGVKSSMSAAMSQVQNNCLARSTLDNMNAWKPSFHSSVPVSSRRSSLAPSNSSLSSPESMISDVSSRTSRSSSISSVASSTCALPQLRLAVQATRRCAKMKLPNLKESVQPILSSPQVDSSWDVFHASPDELPNSVGDYFTRTHCDLPKAQFDSLDCPTDGDKSSTHEAAMALHHFALQQPSLSSHSTTNSRKRENPPATGSTDKSDRTMRCPSTTSRKRERNSSTDLSVQSRVRDLIAPRCLGDITNGTRSSGNNNTVVPDHRLAESFLVLNQSFPFESKIKPNRTVVKDTLPRKRTCGISGTKENCKPNPPFAKDTFKTPAPGMWDGII